MKKILSITGLLLSWFQLQAGGFLVIYAETRSGIIERNDSVLYALECLRLSVNTEINGNVARTNVEQVFYNRTGERLEGYFYFPAPAEATISEFSMDVNGEMTKAELMPASEARQIYRDIVASMQDPALLEYAEQGLFRVRIFPIEPYSEKNIRLEYSEILSQQGGLYQYCFPLNTEKYQAAPLHNLFMQVKLIEAGHIKSLFSPTHTVSIRRDTVQAAWVSYQAAEFLADRDFRLFFGVTDGFLGFGSQSYYQPLQQQGFFLLDIAPGLPQRDTLVIPKDITLVMDISGSMAGEKMEQARQAMLYFTQKLNPGDRFEIITFSNLPNALFGKRVEANAENIAKAREFIAKITPTGGTNINGALTEALKARPEAGRTSVVLFVTDGKPTIGKTDPAVILENMDSLVQGHRVFTFGVGYDLNTYLLDQVCAKGRGLRNYIYPEEDLSVAVSRFLDQVSTPVLTDVKIAFADSGIVYDIMPGQTGDIFAGTSLMLLGKYNRPGTVKVKLSGYYNSDYMEWEQELVLAGEETARDYIPSLWATRKVGMLLDSIRLFGETAGRISQVTELATTYGIVTPYTSYLIIEEQQGFAWDFNTDFMSQQKASYSGALNFEDAEGVNGSRDINTLTNAVSLDQKDMNRKSMDYKDDLGQTMNFASQNAFVNGRNFTNYNGQWVDVLSLEKESEPVKRVQFNTDEYYRMLEEDPEMPRYLSLGTNVRFVNGKGEVIEVY